MLNSGQPSNKKVVYGNGKREIAKMAKLIPMQSIHEEANEESVEDVDHTQIQIKTNVIDIDEQRIEKEELNKLRSNAMFSGYDLRENHFKFDN